MIVSQNENQQRGQVVLQKDHAELAFQLARAFGNDRFEPLQPRRELEYLALHHDHGWDEVDARIQRNPASGLPYSLVNTPIAQLLSTGPRSVAFNTQYHPYCGLLDAMHVWGLFHGRYGLSDKIVVNLLKGEAKEQADRMLAAIAAEQERLLCQLKADPDFARYVETAKLMQNYKALQFFDTLSLYFNDRVGRDGDPTRFQHVPRSQSEDCTVALLPVGQKKYVVEPYPFHLEPLSLHLRSYDVPVLAYDVDYHELFANTAAATETITLVSHDKH